MNVSYPFLLLFLFLFSNGKCIAQVFPDRIAVFDYMNVKSRAQESYIQSEQSWKKVHELRIQKVGYYYRLVSF